MKKINQFATTLLITTIALGSVSAETIATSTTNTTPKVKSTVTLADIIVKGDKAISDRVISLSSAITKLSKYKNLTSDQVSGITASLNTAVADMNNTKIKLDADTDLVTAKADYQSVFKDNRIYAVVLPQQNTMASMDNLISSLTKLKASITNLQAKSDAKAKLGKDVTTLNSSLSDANTKMDDVNTQAKNVLDTVSGLKVDGGDKTIMASNKQIDINVKSIRTIINSDLKSVRSDISSARLSLKNTK